MKYYHLVTLFFLILFGFSIGLLGTGLKFSIGENVIAGAIFMSSSFLIMTLLALDLKDDKEDDTEN